MNATEEGEASTSSSTTSSLAFVPRKLGAGSTRGRGRGRRPGVSTSTTSARPRPPPQLLPHDVDFPEHTLLHARVSLDVDVGSVASEQQHRQRIDRLVRRKLERLAPRTVDYVTLRRVTPSNESGGGGGDDDEERVLVDVSRACTTLHDSDGSPLHLLDSPRPSRFLQPTSASSAPPPR